jgi:hypothetical protein
MTQTLSRDPSDPLFQPVTDRDPATPGDPLSRLRFHYGQCLSAEDFEAEQRYFVLRQRLHNALLHGVGTVWGLAIRRKDPPPDGGDQLVCEPGMAMDPLGREIWVLQPLCLDLAAVEASFWGQLQPSPIASAAAEPPATAAPNPDGPAASAPTPDASAANTPVRRRAYVVLRYEACLSDEVPVIPLPCSDDHDGLAASRLRDSFRLCLEAEAPPDPYATVRDISRRTGWGGRPWSPRRFDRWRAPDGTVWIYDQPRNPDGTYRSDDLSTLQRESALGWQVVRPSSAAGSPGGGPTPAAAGMAPWQGWRQLLLEHALNAPIAGLPIAPGPMERFWSGADDAALLLATLDLEAVNMPANAELQPVRLVPATPGASNPDNSVRAVLPAVQAVADLAFGIRLEGPTGNARGLFQAEAVSARPLDSAGQPTDSGPAAATLIEVRLSLPIAADPAELARGIRLLLKPATSSRWQTVRPQEIRTVSTPEGPSVQLLVKPAWTGPTSFQVVLSGTGPTALLSEGQRPQPLAGVAGEIMPPGSGRDAYLFGTYTPPTT